MEATRRRFNNLPHDNKRSFTVATFGRVGASTPTPHKWVLGLNHTRSGSSKAGMHIPGRDAPRRTKFKQDLLALVVEATAQQAAADASTLGFVVLGDMNLGIPEVSNALTSGLHGVSMQESFDVVAAGVPCGPHVGVECFVWRRGGGKSVASLWHVFDMCGKRGANCVTRQWQVSNGKSVAHGSGPARPQTCQHSKGRVPPPKKKRNAKARWRGSPATTSSPTPGRTA